MKLGIFCYAFLAFVGNGINGQRTTVCDPAEFRQCLEDLVTTTLSSVERESSQVACSERNFTSFRDCTEAQLDVCASYFGDVITTALRPYVGLLDTVYQKACSKDYEYGECDLTTARTCIGEFFHTFSGGGVARTCKQAFLTQQCLQPAMDICSDLSRYLVAVLTDEMKLTSDLLCQPNSCNADIAVQLLSEAQALLSLPATVVRQSSLICRELWTTLALVTNQTAECTQSDIPSGLWNTYQLLYTFADDYCEARTPDSMLTGVPEDLLLPVYLASLGTNRWTSHTDVCRLFNSTMVGAAGRGQIPGPDSQHLYTWRHAMGVTLDRYSSTCLNTSMLDCGWTERAAAGSGDCDVAKAEACLDMVQLSQLVVEVQLQRASWQTVCAVAYNMLACHQYHTGACWTRPEAPALQQIEDMVGYECSQLGPLGSPDTCDGPQSVCDVPAAVGECEALARNLTDICRHQEEVYQCFRERTSGCNSAQASPAQFYLDWFLYDCSHNYSLLSQDNLLGTSQCHIQYGYNLYDGMYMSSDFSWIACAAGSLLEQCMLGTSLPSLAAMYRNQYSDFSREFSAAVCNLTRVNTSPLPPQLTEPSSCEIDHVSGEIAMVILLLSDFPFLSVKDQTTTCSIVPFWSDTVAARMVDCSSQRQALMDDTFVYIRNMHAFYCPESAPAAPNTCDIDRAYTCLEDFGRYAFFASPGDDHCLHLEDVYTCVYDSARHCDNDTQDSLVRDMRAVRSLAAGTTCPLPAWCSPARRDVEAPWITEVCLQQDNCRIYNWTSCVEQYGANLFCSNNADVVGCIESKVSGCDAPQYLLFKLDIQRYISTFGSCGFRMDDPAYITQQHQTLLQCGQMFTTNSVRKEELCSSLYFYLQCVQGVDQTGLSRVWRAAYEANAQVWMKDAYIGCQTNTGDTFIVDPEYNRDDYTGTSCNSDGISCLQSLAEELVTTPFIVPLGHRQADFCNRVQDKGECVIENTAGCTESAQRSLVTSAMWFSKVTKNIGTCSTGTTKPRSCDPEAAMSCLTDLGLELADNINSQATNTVCLKAMSAQKCVNQRTSSCDFQTRSQLEATFSQADTIVSSFCTAPVLAVEDVCGSPGTAQCDVERALVCLVPTQALMLQQTATLEQVCSSVPAMKLCVERWTSGCDEATRGMLARRQFRLSTRLGHQCPQMFCEECQARACLRNLYQALQYDNVHICNVVRDAKQCIHDNAQYCDVSVGAGLLQEVELLVGKDDVRLCEVTLPACLQAFSRSAMQIMGLPQQGSAPAEGQGNQTMTVADMVGAVYPAQVDPAYLCDQATAAYYCVEHHLVADNSSRQQVMLQTLTRIGEIVYDKCQGEQVQCYSCANATSNEECNSWEAQTCAPGQVCGTMINNYYLSKGCVEPDLCQPGCYGSTCSYCCHGDFCNQPWNGVLTEPETCQPLNALWCGLQLLATSTQNATNLTQSCRVLGEHVSCMVDSTADCQQRDSMALGMLGHQLLATDALTACLADNSLCRCGHCTSLLLTTLVSSPYSDKDRFCSAVRKLYRQTLDEMDFVECDRETIHSTAYTVNNAVYMLQGVCPLSTGDSDCTYNGTVVRHGASFPAVDGCNQCTCSQGNVACTLMMCPPEDRCPAIQPGEVGICAFTCSGGDDCRGNQICCPTACGGTSCVNPKPIDTKCHYNGTAYNSSTSFPSADGCNICVCLDNEISCSNFSCVPTTNFTSNATCDLTSVQDCIDLASTNYQIFKEIPGFGNDAICDEAAAMLNCVEPKVSSCPLSVLENVREALWLNFDEILDTCNIQAILQQYSNTTGQNLTLDPTCSVNTGLQCFTSVPQNNTCRSYEAIAECISQYREDCYSRSMAPVLFGLEKELLRLAEDCDIDVPGPSTTPAPTPGPGQPTGDHCSYGNRTRLSGVTFRATDGCNFCYCHKGEIACTELYCPYQGDTPACNITGVEQCIQDTYMAYFVSMATQDGGWQICLSAAAMVRCVEARTASCPNSVVTSVQNIVFYNLQEVSPICPLEQIMYAYSQNTSQPPNHGNTCNMQAVMACLATREDNDEDDICRSQQKSLDCLYNVSQTCYIDLAPTVYTVMQHFQSQSRCQLQNPHTTDKSHCDYGSQKYEVGDNFIAQDGCNLCFCGENGMVGCTKMYCGDDRLHNASCDVSGVRECLQQAALPHLVSLATQDTSHICRAAAQLLRCVEARVTTCPGDVVQVLQGAVWAHLYPVQPYCHLNQLWPPTNITIPDTGKHCELQQAANCVNIRQGDSTCSAYQRMIDCVYNFTSGCLSVDTVPVLYELQRHLEPASMLCDLAVPLMHFDAAYPVAQCTLTFAELLGERLTLGYLVTGQLDGVCRAVAGYLGCLQDAGTTTLGRLYASSARQSADSLVQLCEEYHKNTEPEPEEPVECHSCWEATSQSECDTQPSRTCQPNQVCSTGLQLDPDSGVTIVTKGCADLAWCQAMYGCNMQYMSCIQCCLGSHCNGADNTTAGATTAAPRPSRTTAAPRPSRTTAAPRPSRTTAAPRPSTSSPQENENCDLEPVAIYMTAQVARLVNFNFIPLQQRQPICQNFEARLSSYIAELECAEVTRSRVKVLADWLTGLTDDACQQMEDNPVDETRCYESLTCLDSFGNFTDQMSTCRMLNRTIGCLGNHSAYCQAPVQASVNRSIQLLQDMDHVMCAVNPLADQPQPPCVDLQATTNHSVCNQTAALHCAQYIEKAVNNPFMEKDKFCRIVKAGLACIRDNTYDCDSEVLYQVAPQAAQVIQWAQQACPEAWCPASDHCRLDKANHCLDTLETHAQEMITRGRVDGHTCMSISETHQCVAMATEECYPVDRQAVLRRFSAVAQVMVPLCQAAAASARQCFTVYTEGISTLVSMDEAAVTGIVENVLTQVMLYGYTDGQSASYNTSNMYGGVNLPGGLGQFGESHYEGVDSTGGMLTDSNTGHGNSGWENPYIRRRRQADDIGNPSPMRNDTNGPPDRNSTSKDETAGKEVESDYWTDKNSTHVPGNGTDGRGNHSEPGGGLPTDRAPPMAQSGEGSGPAGWQGLYSLLYGDLSSAEYVRTLTSMANVSVYEVAAVVTPQVLMQHRAHKLRMCQLVQQASTCLNLDLHLSLVPPHTQYTLSTALNLLHGVAMETCQPQQCHSCTDLGSNELCNSQPTAICNPLEMCYVRTSGDLISKGCAPIMTCEERCRHKRWDQTCYCCQGTMCNKHTEQKKGQCDTQRAVACVQNLLTMATLQVRENSTELYSTAMCMMNATSGCHSDAYRAVHKAGQRLLGLYEVASCSAKYDQAFCGVPGAASLVALASSPHQTPASILETCRLLGEVLRAFTNTSCCEGGARAGLALLAVYLRVEPFCPGLNVTSVCTGPRTSSTCRESGDGQQVLENVCDTFTSPQAQNGSTSCSASEALDLCFPALTTDPLSVCPSSAAAVASMRRCVSEQTDGCSLDQQAPVLSVMRNLLLICPLHHNTTQDNTAVHSTTQNRHNNSTRATMVIQCLEPLGNLTALLSHSAHLHTDLCGLATHVDRCLKHSHTPLAVSGLRSLMSSFNTTFCHKQSDSRSDCEPDEIVQCLVDPCSTVNVTTDCPAFPKAQCVSDYCGGCNRKFVFRGEEVTDTCQDMSQMSSCDVDMISSNISRWMNLVSMSPLTVWHAIDRVCSGSYSMDAQRTAILSCPPVYSAPFSAMLSWLQGQLEDICYSHTAHTPCVNPSCDVTKATELINSMGYYLRTWSVDDKVFCQTANNTMTAVDCVLGDCAAPEAEQFWAGVTDVRAQVVTRCPHLLSKPDCHAQADTDTVSTLRPTGPSSTDRPAVTTAPPSRPTRPSNTGRPRPTGGATGRPEGTSRPSQGTSPAPGTSGEEKGCDVDAAKLCLYSAGLPAQNTSTAADYCSNLLSAVVRLSECVLSTTVQCDRGNVSHVRQYYEGIVGRYQAGCSLNMSRQLVARLEAGDCWEPECSYYESHHCILHLTADGDSCGNLEDVSDCVATVSAGCGPHQTYINEVMLRTSVVSMLPARCWPAATVQDTSDQPIVQCVEDLTVNLAAHTKGNITGASPVCVLLGQFLGCLEAVGGDSRVPAPLAHAVAQLKHHATPTLDMICGYIGTDDMKMIGSADRCPAIQPGELGTCAFQCSGDDDCAGDTICCPTACRGTSCANPEPIVADQCSMDQALAILKSHIIDAVLAPIMTQDGKDYVCSYDMSTESWRGAFGYFVAGCSTNQQSDLQLVFDLVEGLGRLAGTCMPRPHTCSPGEAVQCVQELSATLERHRTWATDQHDVCRSSQHAQLCVEQTTSGCDRQVQASLQASFEAVHCEAMTICPALMDQQRRNQSGPAHLPTCLSPTGAAEAGDTTCSPNKAMRCLQSVSEAALPESPQDRAQVCRKYAESMECFMTNLGGCDNVTGMFVLSYGLRVAEKFDNSCPTEIKAFCDDKEHPGCSPRNIQRCLDKFQASADTDVEEQVCFAQEQLSQCVMIHAGSCPQLTRTFLHTKLVIGLADTDTPLNNPDCKSTSQCAFNYIRYMSGSFEQVVEVFGAEAGPVCTQETGESYECGARQGELECMQQGTSGLPDDVAQLVTTSLQYTEAVFSTACSALSGVTEELRGCGRDCLQCYLQEARLQSYLPLMWTFTTVEPQLLYNEEFCSFYGNWKAEVAEIEAVSDCYSREDIRDWHEGYVSGLAEINDKYCSRPCNISLADSCIAELQAALTGSDPCTAYEAAQLCLNDSTVHCRVDVRQGYEAARDQALRDAGVRCYTLPTFQASVSSSTLLEGVPLGLSVTSSGSLAEKCLGQTCQVEISLTFDDSYTSSCSSGEAIPQILTDRCFVYFPANESGTTNTFMLHVRLDHQVAPDRNVSVRLVGRLLEDGEVFAEEQVGETSLYVENRDTSGTCSMIGQPSIRTFDGAMYMNLGKGEYVVYQHTSLPEQVNVRFQSCGGSSLNACPCGVMVQSGDDVYVLDACQRVGQAPQSLTFRIYRNGDYTPHTRVHYDFDGRSTQFVLPSGMIVFVRSVQQQELDVWLHPTGLAWNSTLGLCGTFDGDMDNDFTYRDGTVESEDNVWVWRGSLLPYYFIREWRSTDTLMYGPVPMLGQGSRNNTECVCEGRADCLATDLVETCTFVLSEDYNDLLYVFEVDQSETEVRRRRKRQAPGEFEEGDVTLEMLEDSMTGPSNITEAGAQQYCEDTIFSTGFWNVCSVIVSTDRTIPDCINTILISDSYTAVVTVLEDLKIQCATAIQTDPSLSQFVNMTDEILVPYVLNLTCLEDCSNNGLCVNGECVCSPGYKGDACDLQEQNAPTLLKLSESLYTDTAPTTETAVTRLVDVQGNGFTHSDTLTCHTEQVQLTQTGYSMSGVTSEQSAIFLTGGSVRCQVTGSLPLTGLLLTVSNNGVNQSNGLLYIIQDGVCYDCSVAGGFCNQQPTSCVVDNACYGAGEYKPGNSCFVCDPISNTWQYKPSTSCPDNATTTTTTTTISTPSSSGPTPSPSSPTPSPSSPTPSPSSPTPSPSSPTPSPSSPTPSPSSPTPSPTSPTPSPSSPTQTPSNPTPTPSSPTPSTSSSEGVTEKQDDDDDDRTMLIIIISVAGLMVIVVFTVVICIALRLKRSDRRRHDQSMSSSETPSTLVKAKRGDTHLQGRLNPYFQEVEYATAHGQDQPVIARRAAPTLSAPFNPQGLSQGAPVRGQAGAEGMYEINIGMFEDEKRAGGQPKPTHTWEEVGYRIPRPATSAVYDNAARRSPDKHRKAEEDTPYELGTFTHM